MSRVAVVGGRDFPGAESAVDYFLRFDLEPDDVIITGGARGIDQAAENYSRKVLDREPIIIPPDYGNSVNPKVAPKVRNWRIAHDCERMVAFWDGYSPGTAHAIACAARLGRPVIVHVPGDS